MRVLITGANGFLGVRLARYLADNGNDVLAIVRKIEGQTELQHPNITLVQGDFSDLAVLQTALQGIQQVYHLAAIATDWAADPRSFYKVNVEGTITLIEAARLAGVAKILITSTAGTIGPPDPDHIYPITETHVRRVHYFTDYECSKIMMEERVQHYVKQGVHIILTNPTKVYGPGPIERKNALLLLIHSYLYKTFAPYPAFKTQVGNYAYIDDVVQGHVLAMEKGRSGERYILGGANVTFEDLFTTLHKITGKKGRPIAIPVSLFRFAALVGGLLSKLSGKAPFLTKEWIEKTTYSWPVSSEKAMVELGYAPLDYEVALQKTVAYIAEQVHAGKI